MTRIYLSPPDVGEVEQQYSLRALQSGWVAPLGPEVDAFEAEIASLVSRKHAVALSSGTAALHLALLLADVGAGDEVIVASKTFVASANAVRYTGATPVFVDSESSTWNMCPNALQEALETRIKAGASVKAVIAVDLYGIVASFRAISELCKTYNVALIEDAAEALGSGHNGKAGSFGSFSVFSFNGNKILTTSGGGMLLTDDENAAKQARKLATQAREPVLHYEHEELGYNYRLSNILAAIGRAQLSRFDDMLARRKQIFDRYQRELGNKMTFHPHADLLTDGHVPNYWLTTAICPDRRDAIIEKLADNDIESRPTWKPMHLQPLYKDCLYFGGTVAEDIFRTAICLPSGSSMSDDDLDRVMATIKSAL